MVVKSDIRDSRSGVMFTRNYTIPSDDLQAFYTIPSDDFAENYTILSDICKETRWFLRFID
ncbi:MAG: hypothetical protein IPN18_10765 [Ignavibacteriales bacterium]|nr:hypothetical protein [Ignavibacteriales bacterium]